MTEEQYEIIDSVIEDYICHYDVFLVITLPFFTIYILIKKNLT